MQEGDAAEIVSAPVSYCDGAVRGIGDGTHAHDRMRLMRGPRVCRLQPRRLRRAGSLRSRDGRSARGRLRIDAAVRW